MNQVPCVYIYLLFFVCLNPWQIMKFVPIINLCLHFLMALDMWGLISNCILLNLPQNCADPWMNQDWSLCSFK